MKEQRTPQIGQSLRIDATLSGWGAWTWSACIAHLLGHGLKPIARQKPARVKIRWPGKPAHPQPVWMTGDSQLTEGQAPLKAQHHPCHPYQSPQAVILFQA